MPEDRIAFDRLMEQGWTDALRMHHPDETIYTFGTISGTPTHAMPACASITCGSARPLLGVLINAQVDEHVRGGGEKISDHAPVPIDIADAVLEYHE